MEISIGLTVLVLVIWVGTEWRFRRNKKASDARNAAFDAKMNEALLSYEKHQEESKAFCAELDAKNVEMRKERDAWYAERGLEVPHW